MTLGVSMIFGVTFGVGVILSASVSLSSQSSYLSATKNSKKIMKDQQVFIDGQDGEDQSNEKNRKECGTNFQGVSITQGKQIVRFKIE